MSDPLEGTPEYDAWAAENNGPWILITCWVVTGVSTLFVLGRVYVRGFLQGKLQQDDYWTILAQTARIAHTGNQVCGYISTGLSTAAVASGNGRHFATLTQDQQESAVLWTTAAFCPGVMSFGLPKMAVVYLLTRLLNPSRWHMFFLWWQAIWCQLTLLATVGVLIGRCRPAYSLWNFDVPGECFPNHILVSYCIYAGCFSAFVDLYLAIYPSIVLFQLQMSIKKKIALSVALGIGSVSGIVAIYKTTRIPSLGSPDFSYDTSDLVVWTVIEGSTIMIASSIPILQPLLELVMRRNPFSSGGRSSRKYPEREYENFSDQRSVVYELGERRQRPKPKDDLGLTIMADEGSQEEILAATNSDGDKRSQAQPGTSVNAFSNKRSSVKVAPSSIIRTDEVIVTYDGDVEQRPHNEHPGSWRPLN
ncbi:hypothetical protein S40285_06606 [Stachybotrys chlorohalonatus IBT 40285]|uniref:Rhodopsin domain-containing protein n=1 Tax=Stachybotrys chlorohalonatus (strain IBT 40285) TaxID=1283841 RepID=A0A084R1R4_STAC4|nr:hypothetical protein S40285_06606 [Stachybotrys chlorohalonata IBT 40285]